MADQNQNQPNTNPDNLTVTAWPSTKLDTEAFRDALAAPGIPILIVGGIEPGYGPRSPCGETVSRPWRAPTFDMGGR